MDPSERCSASDILQASVDFSMSNLSAAKFVSGTQAEWMRVTDPATSASAALLEKGTLLYNLRVSVTLF